MAVGALELWNHRSMQILVLLSLGLQFVLYILAGIRRRENAPVRRLLLWLAYLMADSTAVYALGHLLVFSNTEHDHQLVVFWAPFFLLHLGGPDNITAYALEDNLLWLRHLQILVVQVLGAAYVVKKNIHSDNLLRFASFLMFTAGVIKYGERTWALKCGTLESIRVTVMTQPPSIHNHYEASEDQLEVRRAHSLFHICRRAILDSSVIENDADIPQDEKDISKMLDRAELWGLIEIELSLMYDVLYTKAAVVHTWFGYLVRVVSPLAVAASLALFKITSKDGHTEVDIAITYILLGGALFMETTSLLVALGSSWAFVFLTTSRWRWLRYAAVCNERWDRLRRALFGNRYKNRRWSRSRTIGQYNMLHFCTRPADTPLTSPLLGRLAEKLGRSEWWNKKYYSGTIEVPIWLRRSLTDYLKRLYSKGRFLFFTRIGKKWGQDPMERRGLYGEGILKDTLGIEFQEGIIIWHIGTDVFLAKNERANRDLDAPVVEHIKMLSNYMMFLLVERPYMLPGQPQRKLYQRICEKLVSMRPTTSTCNPKPSHLSDIKNLFRVHECSSSSRTAEREQLAKNLYDEYENKEFALDAPRLTHVARLAKQLLLMEKEGTNDSLELVLDVWMDILVYASNKCSRNSHAQKLSNGGEMTTNVWLLAEHLYRASLQQGSGAQGGVVL
jgi:hypothetical protein